MSSLEEGVFLKAMTRLLDEGIPPLPIRDAVYVQEKSAKQAQEAI